MLAHTHIQTHTHKNVGAPCRAKGSSRADGGRGNHSEEDEASDGLLRYPQRDWEVSAYGHSRCLASLLTSASALMAV